MHPHQPAHPRPTIGRYLCLTLALSVMLPFGIAGGASRRRVVVRRATSSYSVRILGDAQTITAGATATFPFVVTRTRGFRGAITFDVPDLPPGVSASFNARSTTSFDLKMTTTTAAASGSATYFLHAHSRAIDRKAMFRLALNPAPGATTTAAAAASTVPAATTTSPTPTTAATPTTAGAVGDFSIATDVQTRTIAPGEKTSFTIRVDRRGFTGNVSFKTEGLPAGIEASASPDPSPAGSTLNITSAATTASGVYLLVISGSGSGLTRSVAVRLAVRRTGPFTLSVSPNALTTSAGNDAPTGVTVGPAAGSSLIPDVSLDISGAPAGVAVQTPSTDGKLTKLVLSTSADTAAGTYRLTVVGRSGTFTQTADFTLTVTRDVPGFGISATPASVSVNRGSAGSYEVKVVPRGGFTQTVTFTVTGLPPTATSVIEAAPNSVIVRVTTTPSTPATSYPLLITGRSGTLEATIQVTLVVVAPAV